MKHKNIVMLCQQNWDIGLATNAKNLAKEFAKSHRVLYVNLPLDLNTVLRGFGKPGAFGQADVKKRLRLLFGEGDGLMQAEPNLWVLTPQVLSLSINWLRSRGVFCALNRWNSKRLAGSIQGAARTLGFDGYTLFQDGIIFQGLELKSLLVPQHSVYYLRDYTLGVPYFARHGPWVEAQLMRQADVVVANSAYLGDYARQHTPRAYDIGQGCVLAMYRAEDESPEPADLAGVAEPRILYTGFLTGIRLDLDLLLTIARRHPDRSLVLVGPEDETFRRSALHGLPNVHFLGSKRPEELAAYLRHCDVCINPQAVNAATVGNYPLKIDEYLAMGKPVVATATRTMELFADHVYLATGPDHWLALLDRALAKAGPSTAQARVAFARSHTWAASAAALYRALEAAPPKKTDATPVFTH